MNVAKYIGSYNGSEWSYELNYHLLDHLRSRQVVCDADGEVKGGLVAGDVEYSTFGEYEEGEALMRLHL